MFFFLYAFLIILILYGSVFIYFHFKKKRLTKRLTADLADLMAENKKLQEEILANMGTLTAKLKEGETIN